MVETIKKVVEGKITPIKQNDEESTYAPMLNKEIAKIDWNKSAEEIHNHIRGMNPWPIATTIYDDKVMKVYESDFETSKSTKEPGVILKADKKGIVVSTKEGNLIIKKLQFPNGKPLMVEQFINGNDIEIGKKLL